VDIVFSGHSHIYERFYPIRPDGMPDGTAVTYITTGGAGAGLYESVSIPSVLAYARSVNHFVDVQIDGDVLEMSTIDMEGKVLDSLRIVKKNGERVFSDKVIPAELLNTVTEFTSVVSGDIFDVPLHYRPALYEIDMHSWSSGDIPYTISLTPRSGETYLMEPYTDTLRPGTDRKIFLEIRRKKEITISDRGIFSPALQLMVIYEYMGKKDTIVGKPVHYWPPRKEETTDAAVDDPAKVLAGRSLKEREQMREVLKDLPPVLSPEWSCHRYIPEMLTTPGYGNGTLTFQYRMERCLYGGFPGTGGEATGFFRLVQTAASGGPAT